MTLKDDKDDFGKWQRWLWKMTKMTKMTLKDDKDDKDDMHKLNLSRKDAINHEAWMSAIHDKCQTRECMNKWTF